MSLFFQMFSDKLQNKFYLCSVHLLTQENISSDKLKILFDNVTKKNFAEQKFNHLANLAKNSFGITFGLQSLKLQLQFLIAQISFIEEQVAQIDSEIADLLDKLNSPITTIPGIGKVIAATILSEIGDIHRFATPAKLVAYAELLYSAPLLSPQIPTLFCTT